jgi:hypothetical protein
MAAISAYSHEQFVKHVRTTIQFSQADSELRLQEDLMMLERIHLNYQDRIYELKQLMKDYKFLQQKVRINIRRQQLSQKIRKKLILSQ